jgi:hypothetical protein
LRAQLKDLSTRLQTLEDLQGQVTGHIARQDHARATHAAEEVKKSLQAMQSAQLSMQPVTQASLRFAALQVFANGISSVGEIVDSEPRGADHSPDSRMKA